MCSLLRLVLFIVGTYIEHAECAATPPLVLSASLWVCPFVHLCASKPAWQQPGGAERGVGPQLFSEAPFFLIVISSVAPHVKYIFFVCNSSPFRKTIMPHGCCVWTGTLRRDSGCPHDQRHPDDRDQANLQGPRQSRQGAGTEHQAAVRDAGAAGELGLYVELHAPPKRPSEVQRGGGGVSSMRRRLLELVLDIESMGRAVHQNKSLSVSVVRAHQ